MRALKLIEFIFVFCLCILLHFFFSLLDRVIHASIKSIQARSHMSWHVLLSTNPFKLDDHWRLLDKWIALMQSFACLSMRHDDVVLSCSFMAFKREYGDNIATVNCELQPSLCRLSALLSKAAVCTSTRNWVLTKMCREKHCHYFFCFQEFYNPRTQWHGPMACCVELIRFASRRLTGWPLVPSQTFSSSCSDLLTCSSRRAAHMYSIHSGVRASECLTQSLIFAPFPPCSVLSRVECFVE